MQKNIVLLILIVLSGCKEQQESESSSTEVFYIRSGSVDLPVWIRGSNSEKIIIFLHGGPGSSSSFVDGFPFFRQLSKKYKIVFWDQRGAGGAEGVTSTKSISISHMLGDLYQVHMFVLKKYPNSQIYLMGHSFGGMLGAAYLSMYSNMFKASIFLAPAFTLLWVKYEAPPVCLALIKQVLASPDLAHPEEIKDWRDLEKFYTENSVLSASSFSKHYQASDMMDKIQKVRGLTMSEKDALGIWMNSHPIKINPFEQEKRQKNVVYSLEVNGDGDRDLSTDSEYNLAKINRPVLVIVGKQDCLVPPSVSRKGFDAMNAGTPNPKSEYIIFPYSSHRPYEANPQECLDKVLQFMSKN